MPSDAMSISEGHEYLHLYDPNKPRFTQAPRRRLDEVKPGTQSGAEAGVHPYLSFAPTHHLSLNSASSSREHAVEPIPNLWSLLPECNRKMATFTAYNVEPDDRVDEEVDNTRELVIEEALKLYQNALKLHAGGPKHYDEAAVAYDALFNSEIFNAPEATTEFARTEENPYGELDNDVLFTATVDLAEASADGPSTLPQILYLAYKNKGQFIMDCLKQKLRSTRDIPRNELRLQAKDAMEHFIQALARDESDTELWRRASRLGTFLGSTAIARYCLEAAVEVDDDPTLAEVEPAGLEEGFAGTQLNGLLKDLSDEVALSHPIMGPYNKKTMSKQMKKYMDPYPFLPDPIPAYNDPEYLAWKDLPRPRIQLDLTEVSWTALGDSLWKACVKQLGSGSGVMINLPNDIEMAEAVDAVPEAEQPHLSHGDSMKLTKDENINGNMTASGVAPVPLKHTESQASLSAEPEQDSGLSSRKRSQSVAGIQDNPDEETGAQKRSKRIRNRDTNGADAAPLESTTQFKEQLGDVRQADTHTFDFIGSLLEKLSCNDLGTIDGLQDAVAQQVNSSPDDAIQNSPIRDLQDIMKSWNDNKASLLWSTGPDIVGPSGGSANTGILAFLEHSKVGPKRVSVWPAFSDCTGISSFVKRVNDGWMPLQDVVYDFLKAIYPSYKDSLWPEAMKHTVCRLVNLLDAEIYTRLQEDTERSRALHDKKEIVHIENIVQILFELHLDIYANITNPNSVVDFATRIKEKDSLNRWAAFAVDVINQHVGGPNDELCLRYLWGAAFYVSLADGVDREHVIGAWSDMQAIIKECGDLTIELQNNAIMPEVSAIAADREISRLTTMDFFMNLFQSDRSDPVGIIETLEPVLLPESVGVAPESETGHMENSTEGTPQVEADAPPAVPDGLRDMWKFLQGGSTSLRLFLWQRLREAYETIDYKTKVFSCYLKSIEIIVADFRTPAYVDSPLESRQHSLLTWFNTLDELLVKTLTLALNNQTAFDIIDDAHIKSSASAVAQLTRILHSAAIFDDGVRVGMIQLPTTAPYTANGGVFGYAATLNKLREMQVRSWALLYTILKDGMAQNCELFRTPESDLADYLAAVHQTLGLRKCCKVSNKIFLKMMKVELVRMKNLDPWEDYLGQVLFDLYGVRLGSGTWEIQDHGCPTEPLDRRTTTQIAIRVIKLANRMSMKDLLKSELRPTIERMQQAVGVAKTSPQMQHNFRNMTESLKKSIDFLRFIQAMKGQYDIDSIPVTTPESPLADSGWYFLLGMIALAKFRAQKRVSAGATDDLKVAASFFRLQLQFSLEHWETWYRLAQCFDAELEEDVLWSSDKLNSPADRAALNTLQRSAIHCYTMAVSKAMNNADESLDTASKMSDMYFDFGMRIYSSSRDPFSMEVFWLDDFQRHFSSGVLGMYTKSPHEEMSRFKAWRFACRLFQRALADKPDSWMNHYMLGKCLWKMYFRGQKDLDLAASVEKKNIPNMQSVLNAFIKAIEKVPKPRDARAEPIFEPHYKLMSIVHKLVTCGWMESQEAANILQQRPYAIRKGENMIVTDSGMWREFILESIRHLRNADKSNWHHRMIFRVAKIICPDSPPDAVMASGARAELKESMFTKTMVVQVWKPEYERSGRHCVYMSRYVKFMIELLLQLDDKTHIEALVKRVRKKQAEYFKFDEIWTLCCRHYLTLLRRAGSIAPNQDDLLKSVTTDEFYAVAEALSEWTNDPESSHPALDCLREVTELRRLNANLLKPQAIDDLMADAFATLYFQVGMNLPRPALPPLQTPLATDAPRSQGPMSLNNLVSNMDGTNAAQIQFGPQVPPSEAIRERKKGVSRREILRRAESAVQRVPEQKPYTASRSQQSLIDGYVSRVGGMDGANDVRRGSLGANPLVSRLQDEGEEQSSAPGSVHDSADDESDLSDVPEDIDEEPVPIFPNLTRSTGGAPTRSEGDGGSGRSAVDDQA